MLECGFAVDVYSREAMRLRTQERKESMCKYLIMCACTLRAACAASKLIQVGHHLHDQVIGQVIRYFCILFSQGNTGTLKCPLVFVLVPEKFLFALQ